MPIYTRTGDNGETGLVGGKRIYKCDPQVEAYGNVDELSSFLGLIVSTITVGADQKLLTSIQKDLYAIMAYLAGSPSNLDSLEKEIKEFERVIDLLDKQLPKLSRFIIPQGTIASSYFHIARTVCRRTERCVVGYMRTQPSMNEELQATVRYLNRLSDLLFMFARKYNKSHEKVV